MFVTIPWNIGLMNLGGRWQIACVNMFWKKFKLLLLGQAFLSLNADEVIIIVNQSWLLMHVYVMHAWKIMLLRVKMQIILLLWLLNPSCSKGFDSRRDSQEANLFWCLWGLPFPRLSHWSDRHFNWRRNMFLTWWDNIAWPIGRILLFKLCQIYPWWPNWKIC
jgi:hypothetical protein